MANAMRHAGMHFPNMAEHPSLEYIAALPGVRDGVCLMLATEGRYHWQAMKDAAPQCTMVWRAIPRAGHLPADLRWDAKKLAAEVLNLYDEAPHGAGEWFLPLNELSFVKEAGENFRGYGPVAQDLDRLRQTLRPRLPGVNLLFPAWVPGDDLADERFDDWASEAMQYEGICLHAYGEAGEIVERYRRLRSLLTDRFSEAGATIPILIGEWNGPNEYSTLAALATLATSEGSRFLGATYYIWSTENDGEQHMSVWGNDDRLHLFLYPPGPVDAPAPPPVVLPPPPDPTPVEPVMALPRGIDVASYQGDPDWVAVAAAGYVFGMTKATQSTGYVNPTFRRNWSEIKRVGLARGAYHWGDPDGDAEAQARHFLDTVGPLEAGDMLVLDAEEGDGDVAAWALDWARAVERIVGFAPIIYTGRWFSDDHGFPEHAELAAYPLWLAAYQAEMPAAPAPWTAITFWQHSSEGQVPGIAGDVDLNVFNGPADGIRLCGKPVSDQEVIVPPPARVTYDAATPAIAQNDPASCSATSLRWALTSLGRHPDERWIEDTMVAEGVMSWEQGLLDASGAGLAAFIRRQYGEFGFNALSWSGVSFDAVADAAGESPLLLGGRAWGHWTGVRGFDSVAEMILLANPADGYMGVAQRLSRERFNALGPFSLVQVTHPDLIGTPADPPVEEGEDMARIAELEQQLRDTWGLIGESYGSTGSVRRALDTALAHSKPASHDTKSQLLKRLNDLRHEVEAVDSFLKTNDPAA